ncbi:MAG TPA: hypothetical protein VFN21_12890 [Acidimicrobiales bacterium]|nr:hypothetical protein [Acidimicrobiales bacterium]
MLDKLWLLDLTLGEFRGLLDEPAEVIEETVTADGELRELVLSLHWTQPLHVVVVVDEVHEKERLITVYQPSTEYWSDNFKVRR